MTSSAANRQYAQFIEYYENKYGDEKNLQIKINERQRQIEDCLNSEINYISQDESKKLLYLNNKYNKNHKYEKFDEDSIKNEYIDVLKDTYDFFSAFKKKFSFIDNKYFIILLKIFNINTNINDILLIDFFNFLKQIEMAYNQYKIFIEEDEFILKNCGIINKKRLSDSIQILDKYKNLYSNSFFIFRLILFSLRSKEIKILDKELKDCLKLSSYDPIYIWYIDRLNNSRNSLDKRLKQCSEVSQLNCDLIEFITYLYNDKQKI